MAGDRKLVVIQPEAADPFAALAGPWKFHFRLRIRSFCLVVGIDRLAEIGDRHFSGAFRNLVDKGKFRLDPRSKLFLDLIPINLLPGGFAPLVLFQSPIPGEAGDAGSAIEIGLLWRCRIEPNFMRLDHL